MKPLMAATAVLLLGAACTSGHSAAKPAPTTTSVPTTTSTTSTTTTTVATSTTRPRSTTTTLAALHPRPCCSTTPGGPLRVSFTGLTAGQRIPNDGRVVDFTVTFTNGTSTNYPSVAPVVATDHYDGVPGPTKEADGKLQRYNRASGAWEDIPLSVGTGMDHMYGSDSVAFPLPPGHSVSVQYRISLTPDDGPGTLPIDGIAARTSDHSDIGNIDVPVIVTSG